MTQGAALPLGPLLKKGTEMPVKTGSLRIPGKPSTKRVWVGSYGGHFDVVVVFGRKPKKGGKGSCHEGEYDVYENRHVVAGTFDKDAFNEWFGTNVQPSDARILAVEPYDLTAIWDEHGRITGLDTHYD